MKPVIETPSATATAPRPSFMWSRRFRVGINNACTRNRTNQAVVNAPCASTSGNSCAEIVRPFRCLRPGGRTVESPQGQYCKHHHRSDAVEVALGHVHPASGVNFRNRPAEADGDRHDFAIGSPRHVMEVFRVIESQTVGLYGRDGCTDRITPVVESTTGGTLVALYFGEMDLPRRGQLVCIGGLLLAGAAIATYPISAGAASLASGIAFDPAPQATIVFDRHDRPIFTFFREERTGRAARSRLAACDRCGPRDRRSAFSPSRRRLSSRRGSSVGEPPRPPDCGGCQQHYPATGQPGRADAAAHRRPQSARNAARHRGRTPLRQGTDTRGLPESDLFRRWLLRHRIGGTRLFRQGCGGFSPSSRRRRSRG